MSQIHKITSINPELAITLQSDPIIDITLDEPKTLDLGVQLGDTETQHAVTADRLTTPRKISLSGQARGSGYFDGSSDIDIPTVVSALTNAELEDMLK